MKFLCVAATMLLALLASAGELQDAASRGDIEKVRALIKSNLAGVSAREGGTTALHEATRAGHLEIVKLLVANGANVNATDFSGLTPLKMALGRRQVEVAEFLRQSGGVEKVAPAPRATVATNAVAAGSKLFSTNAPALRSQIASVSPKTNASAGATIATNRPPTERELMPVIFPIHEAARVGDVEQIKFLFKNSPDLIDATDEKGLTPLHVAAANRQLAVAQTLTALRAKVNVKSDTGQTPLHAAVRNGDVAIVSLLLSNRAAVDVPDNFGTTPLLVALQSSAAESLDAGGLGAKNMGAASKTFGVASMTVNQLQLATLLVRGRADVNVRNRAGATPLTEAVRLGNAPVVNLLLSAGANPNVAETAGKTPLHVAAARGNLGIVEALIQHRAPVNAPDGRGETPLCYALREGRTNTIAALRAAGATIGQARALSPTEQSLVDFYRQTESALQKGSSSDKARAVIALNPTKADCERMFPKHAASAWRVVDEINKQIRQAFAKPVQDAEQGKEIWRIMPEAPGLIVQEWRGHGWLAKDLPVFSLAVDKVGATSRPGDYCFVNGHWVVVPPLRTIAAQFADADRGKR